MNAQKFKEPSFSTLPYEFLTPEQRFALTCIEIRRKLDWSRAQLAAYMDVVHSTVYYWENAKVFPKNEVIYKFATLKGVPVEELVAYLYNTYEQEEKAVTVAEVLKCAMELPMSDVVKLIHELTKVLMASKN